MPKFLVNLSGFMEVEAANADEAAKLARQQSGPYVWANVREVGKDCDELGWALPKPGEAATTHRR